MNRSGAHRVGRTNKADRGNGTLLGLGLILAAVALIGLGLLIQSWVLVQHRVEAAADLTALAVAQQAADQVGQSQACAAGAVVAERNGAVLDDCEVVVALDQVGVKVSVSATLTRRLPGLPGQAHATSYAGNPSGDPGG